TSTGADRALVDSGSSEAAGLAIDGSGDLYVADNTFVVEYSPAGSKITAFAQTQLTGGGGWGVAIDNGNGTTKGDVYASNINQGAVNVSAPVHPPGPPAIATKPANAISTTSATLDSQIT